MMASYLRLLKWLLLLKELSLTTLKKQKVALVDPTVSVNTALVDLKRNKSGHYYNLVEQLISSKLLSVIGLMD